MRFPKRPIWWLMVPALALLALAIPALLQVRQQSAIERIERLGGRVLTTHSEPAWLNRLTRGRSRAFFERATVVNLSETEITDRDLAVLETLKGLERLNLSGTEITDQGLLHLANLTTLKALDLTGTRIRGPGLVQLAGLGDLEYLYLGGTDVGDEGLGHLRGFARLKHLNIAGTAVTRQGIEHFQYHLPEAEVIY